jgi:FKBP-type peptidyl-prolyl cis-trans isomerase SlyD
MQIAAKSVVSIDYTLKSEAGDVLDTSEGKDPLTYLHGVGNLVPGLERALEGHAAGDALEVSLPPAEGYGDRDEKLVRNLPVRKLATGGPDKKPQVGRRYRAQLDDGMAVVLVTGLKGDYATVDANHPLAGMTLHFQVKVVSVREATEEELKHGHVHGPDDHHHHH